MYYPDDFYEEPSEFDEKVEEFKESLAKAVKGDFLEEMERLKAENRNLQGIKEHFEQVKRDYERKKQECERAAREAEARAKSMRIEELMEKFRMLLWSPDWEYLYGPKCGKCDKDRRVMVTLPSGRTVTDECECMNSKTKVMLPKRMVLYQLGDGEWGKIDAWYKECGEEGGRYYTLQYARSTYAEKNMVEPGTSFDVLAQKENQGNLLFTTEEECRAYCEYLNEKNLAPADAIYGLDGEVWEKAGEDSEANGFIPNRKPAKKKGRH